MFDLKKYQVEMTKVVDFLMEKMKAVRTGRAHPDMLDGVRVEVYGALLPLNQVANVVVTDAQLLTVTPFDTNNLQAIAGAIRSDRALGFNPSDDGRVVRVPIPSLTEERRREIVKQTREKVEESKVAVRNLRQDAIKEIKKLKDAKSVSEDEAKRLEKAVQELVDKTQDQIEAEFVTKEKDLMTI